MPPAEVFWNNENNAITQTHRGNLVFIVLKIPPPEAHLNLETGGGAG